MGRRGDSVEWGGGGGGWAGVGRAENRRKSLVGNSEPEPAKQPAGQLRTAKAAFWTVQNRRNSLLDSSEPLKQLSGSFRTGETAFWTIENRQNSVLERSEQSNQPSGPFTATKTSGNFGRRRKDEILMFLDVSDDCTSIVSRNEEIYFSKTISENFRKFWKCQKIS